MHLLPRTSAMTRMHVNVEALNLRSSPGPATPETF